MPKLYAAYGSNLNESQMRQICGRKVEKYGTGKIFDFELEFRLYANIRRRKGSVVQVAVWQVTDADISKLDQFEGVFQGIYKKAEIKVKMSNGDDVVAFIYILQKRMPLEKPYETYYKMIADGYIEHDFDVIYLKEAKEKTPKQSLCTKYKYL